MLVNVRLVLENAKVKVNYMNTRHNIQPNLFLVTNEPYVLSLNVQ